MIPQLRKIPGTNPTSGSRNPITGSRATTPPGFDRVQTRTMHVRGKDRAMQVYVLAEDELYIVARPTRGKAGIPRGAVLVRNQELAVRGGKDTYLCYERGLYAALRGQGTHVPARYDREISLLRELDEETFLFALTMGRVLFHDRSPEAEARYRAAVEKLGAELSGSRHPLKEDALRLAKEAVSITDARGRRNPASRLLKLWAGRNRLEQRVNLARALRHFVDGRVILLLQVRDRILAMTRDLGIEADRAQELIDGSADERALHATAKRLETAADRFERVALAPFGRHAFPHHVRDLRAAAAHLREGKTRQARAVLDRLNRSLRLNAFHPEVEDVLAVVSGLKEMRENIAPGTFRALRGRVSDVHRRLAALQRVDAGFRRRVVADLLRHLQDAVEALKQEHVFRTYECLTLAARCF